MVTNFAKAKAIREAERVVAEIDRIKARWNANGKPLVERLKYLTALEKQKAKIER